MSFDDDEALFEDIYGDDETQVSEEPKVEEKKSEEKSATPAPAEPVKADSAEVKSNSETPSTQKTSQVQEPAQPQQTTQSDLQPQQSNQYGQQQQPVQSQGYSQPPPQQNYNPMPPSNLGKDHGKMFIGGLNWDTTEEGLKAYFSKYGEVIDFTIMRDNANGKSRGFGFLTFADPKSVDEVIKTDHILDGKLIDPKRAIARDEQDKVGKIFVGGIDPMVNEQDFNEFFSQFGSIVDAQLMIDKDTGRSRGFGFITYDSPEAVDRVTVNKYLTLKGKAMEVKRAEPRGQHQQNQQSQQYQQQSQYGNYGNSNYGGQAYGAQAPQQQQYGANGMSPEMMQEYWQRMQQWYMYQQQAQQASGQTGGEDDGEKPQEPLNPQQQSELPPPPPPPAPQQQGYDRDYSNSSGGSSDYPSGPKRLPPTGPRRAPPSGPSGGYRGRGGYQGRGGYGRGGYGRGSYQGRERGGYHPYNKR
ncbi:nuclear polyadenylated RNA-binding protein 4 [[Candida] railenensis]|uniref:Nuclear polyadenylated RNA-binding protein 4 n=1 Tax=[Candida] railenensis TaxID=45579 RepID=A0A9P0QN38_9ASCO|nr:nuclear polyadenylated RNA-binding protein 4 [[Candida] railenensis]